MRQTKGRACAVMAGAILALQGALLAFSAAVHTPTIDEPAHLGSGIAIWQSGRFDLYCVNPPLVRALAAVPLVASGLEWRADADCPESVPRREFAVGTSFLRSRSFGEAVWSVALARWACIPLVLWGGLVCYRFARELYGPSAGLMAAALWCFCPNVLGHGSLITPDAGAAAMGITACWLYWRWLRQRRTLEALLAGLGLALAELTKMTWVILFGLWPMIWGLTRCRARKRQTNGTVTTEALQLGLILLVGLYGINMGYAFEGTCQRLGDYHFVSRALGGTNIPLDRLRPNGNRFGGPTDRFKVPTGNRFRGTWLGALPVPLPANYLLGIDVQKRDFELGGPSYLRGEWQWGGWWYYYLYGLAVKVPLGVWLLGLLAVFAGMRWRRCRRWLPEEFVTLAPAAAVLVLVSSQTGFSHHLRYVLPAFPLVYVSISRVAAAAARHRHLGMLAAVALAGAVASSLFTYPHSLSYFNELVGGPRNGHWHLLDSNIDWGQDFLYLKAWAERHPEARPVRAAGFFGVVPLTEVGLVDYHPRLARLAASKSPHLDDEDYLEPGWYAVSAHRLHGGVGDLTSAAPLETLLHLEPVGSAGYSIYIYHITPEEADRLRQARQPPPGGAGS